MCSQAEGEVLEIAAGTGRNLSFYPQVRLTMTEFTPAMLEIARHATPSWAGRPSCMGEPGASLRLRDQLSG